MSVGGPRDASRAVERASPRARRPGHPAALVERLSGRHALALWAALSFSFAPYQCASDPDPERAMEDSAPRALWELSERFREAGDAEARADTLGYLAERYPSSRYAHRARLALERQTSGGSAGREDPTTVDAPAGAVVGPAGAATERAGGGAE